MLGRRTISHSILILRTIEGRASFPSQSADILNNRQSWLQFIQRHERYTTGSDPARASVQVHRHEGIVIGFAEV